MSAPGQQTIWKFTIKITDEQTLEIPGLVWILDVQTLLSSEGDRLALWAVVRPNEPKSTVRIGIVGTGNPFTLLHPGVTHLKTLQIGLYVWHVFLLPDTGVSVKRETP